MDQILLCTNHLPPVTTIYNSFIRHEMLDANGSYVKVYLYLNMCIQSGNTAFSISSLADQMENTEKDIIRALNYWEKKKLLMLQRNKEENTITGIEFMIPGQAETPQPENSIPAESPAVSPAKQDAILQTKGTDIEDNTCATQEKTPVSQPAIHINEDQFLRLSTNNDFKWITTIVQNFLKRPVSSAETELLMYLYDNLQFSRDLILYLYEYCCTSGKTHVKYVQTVALSWAEQNISTPEQAKAASTSYNATYTAISKAFGLGRTLGAVEMKYIDQWSHEWKFELAVILEACSRTLLRTQKADFKYADSILSNWHKNGIHTLQEVQSADEQFAKQKAAGKTKKQNTAPTSNMPAAKNQFQSFQQRSLSAEEMTLMEKKLLAKQ